MNSHRLIDERSYEMHRVIARILSADPSCLDLVARQMDTRLADPDYSESLKDCVREWRGIVADGLDRVLSVLEDRSDEGQRLRQNTPFAILMPQEERMRILRRYRQNEPIRAGAHPAGV